MCAAADVEKSYMRPQEPKFLTVFFLILAKHSVIATSQRAVPPNPLPPPPTSNTSKSLNRPWHVSQKALYEDVKMIQLKIHNALTFFNLRLKFHKAHGKRVCVCVCVCVCVSVFCDRQDTCMFLINLGVLFSSGHLNALVLWRWRGKRCYRKPSMMLR